MDFHPQPDWQRALGQHVEIRRAGAIVRAGVVEAITPDNSILWISAAGAEARAMYERAEGYEVFARCEWNSVLTQT